jgi:hypothetical protein
MNYSLRENNDAFKHSKISMLDIQGKDMKSIQRI